MQVAQKLFSEPAARDHSGSQSDTDDTVPLEDPTVPLLPWDTVSSEHGHNHRPCWDRTKAARHLLYSYLMSLPHCSPGG